MLHCFHDSPIVNSCRSIFHSSFISISNATMTSHCASELVDKVGSLPPSIAINSAFEATMHMHEKCAAESVISSNQIKTFSLNESPSTVFTWQQCNNGDALQPPGCKNEDASATGRLSTKKHSSKELQVLPNEIQQWQEEATSLHSIQQFVRKQNRCVDNTLLTKNITQHSNMQAIQEDRTHREFVALVAMARKNVCVPLMIMSFIFVNQQNQPMKKAPTLYNSSNPKRKNLRQQQSKRSP